MPILEPLTQHIAQPPRPPEPTPAQQRRESARLESLRARFHVEHRSLLRGLILLAVLILIGSLLRAGSDRLFVPGWWQQW